MFLFRCCMRVGPSSQSEQEAEVLQTPVSSGECLSRYDSQIQRRLLPQPVDTSRTKQFADYSGCSHTTGSCPLLVGSRQSLVYEEVLCVSVPSEKDDDVCYTDVNGGVVCRPACSVGMVNNNFSPDVSSSNNNTLEVQSTHDDVKLAEDDGSDHSVSSESSDSSSETSNCNDNEGGEVKYVADIRHFPSVQTSGGLHGEGCCCSACQPLCDSLQRYLTHQVRDFKCVCVSCVEFHGRMKYLNTNQLLVSDTQDNKVVNVSQSPPSEFSVVCDVIVSDSFKPQSIDTVSESASVHGLHSDVISAASPEEEVQSTLDDHMFSYSADDELHYVFHKFIDDSCLEETFTNVLMDERVWLNPVRDVAVQPELEHALTKSADDLEVAYFMDRQLADIFPVTTFISSCNGSYVTNAVSATASVQSHTVASEDMRSYTAERMSDSFNPILGSLVHSFTLSESGFQSPDSNAPKDIENNPAISVSNAGRTNLSETMREEVIVEANQQDTASVMDFNLNIFNDEIQKKCFLPDSIKLNKDGIAQEFSESLFALPGSADSQDISVIDSKDSSASFTAHRGCAYSSSHSVISELDEGLDILADSPVKQPLSIVELNVSSQTCGDAFVGNDGSHMTADVEAYIRRVVAELVQNIVCDALDKSIWVPPNNILADGESLDIHAPVLSSVPAEKVECDTPIDSVLDLMNSDVEIVSPSHDVGDSNTTSDVVGIAAMTPSHGNEVTDTESWDISQVDESYLMLDDVLQLEQHVSDDVDLHPLCMDKNTEDAVRMEQDFTLLLCCKEMSTEADSDLNLDLHSQKNHRAPSHALSPTGLVDDFFKQYVVPVEAGGADASAAEVGVCCEDVKVDEGQEGLAQVQNLEIVAKSIVDAVISDAVAVTTMNSSGGTVADTTSSPTTSADIGAQPLRPSRSSLQRLPSEAGHKKSVHFADMHGLQLESVQRYDKSPELQSASASLDDFLSKLSAAAAERRAKWTDRHPSRRGLWLCDSSVYLLACFELAGSQQELLDRVQHCRVALESCSFDDMSLAISGIVRVANIAFQKTVLVRYTIDHWTTQTEITGEYIPQSSDGLTDRFSFTIILPSRKQFVVGSEVEFAVCFLAGDSFDLEFWDNNHGCNYVVRCCSKSVNFSISTDNDDD